MVKLKRGEKIVERLNRNERLGYPRLHITWLKSLDLFGLIFHIAIFGFNSYRHQRFCGRVVFFWIYSDAISRECSLSAQANLLREA